MDLQVKFIVWVREEPTEQESWDALSPAAEAVKELLREIREPQRE
jgi:hypothetical protein